MPHRIEQDTEPARWPVAPLTSIAAIEYGRGGETALELDLLGPYPLPSSPLPTIVRTTGEGWAEENRAGASMQPRPPGARFLAGAGFLVAVVSSRLSWQATFPAQIHDVKAAIRWLRANAGSYPIDPSRIGIIGDSAGGHLAALAALTTVRPDLEGDSGSPGYSSAVQATVAISAPTDFLAPGAYNIDTPPSLIIDLFGGTVHQHREMMRIASPIYHVHRQAPPFLIVHGTRDETVPFDQGERLHHALAHAGSSTSFVPIEGGFHNLRDTPDTPYVSPIWDRVGELVIDFFDQTLRPTSYSQRTPPEEN